MLRFNLRLAFLLFAAASLPGIVSGQEPDQKATPKNTKPQQGRTFGTSYAKLRPEQKKLIDDYFHRYAETTGTTVNPQMAYDKSRLSLRTTFEAISHALVTVELTDEKGKKLGRAVDIIEAVENVAGEEPDVGGDRQFRMYVYLKPSTMDLLRRSREFKREHDNTVYHKGFPTCFRLDGGPPSIQISISRDHRMADIDVDYRSSGFPKALFNGHLTASNSDVRAGNNLDLHDGRWQGLNGWWRNVFGFSLGSASRNEVRRQDAIPLNPNVKANRGVDEAAHDFLKNWVVDQQYNQSVAYLSRRSYPCLEAAAKRNHKPIEPGMARIRVRMVLQNFVKSHGSVKSVKEMFAAQPPGDLQLKEFKNAYPDEFRLVAVPEEIAGELECVPISDTGDEKPEKGKFFATAFHGLKGDSQNKALSLLWSEEDGYWKIIAVRFEDAGNESFVPRTARKMPAEVPIAKYPADPKAVKEMTDFYEAWFIKRDPGAAAKFASEKSYGCLSPLSAEEKKTIPEKPDDRIRLALQRMLERAPSATKLEGVMESVQPVNELLRPVDQANSKAFAIMAVPEQMAASFTCEGRQKVEKTSSLEPAQAKYGAYYTTASRLRIGAEKSAALLLLWAQEHDRWKVIAWAVELP